MAASEPRRVRLEETSEPSFLPWVKSRDHTSIHLYWLPFTMPENLPRQRQWVLAFAEKLEAALTSLTESEPYFFLQVKVVNDHLSQPFYLRSRELMPLVGLSRKPGAPLPALPDDKYIEGLQTGRIKYDHKALQPDYCYHFLYQNMRECMSQFFGVGGASVLFLPRDTRERPPSPRIPEGVHKDPGFAPLMQFARVEETLGALHRMQSPAFPRSRLLFGRGLEENLQARGHMFIVPLLSIEAFQQASAADLEEWFSFFNVALVESPADRGLVLASRVDLDLTLDRITHELRDEHLEYVLYA